MAGDGDGDADPKTRIDEIFLAIASMVGFINRSATERDASNFILTGHRIYKIIIIFDRMHMQIIHSYFITTMFCPPIHIQ